MKRRIIFSSTNGNELSERSELAEVNMLDDGRSSFSIPFREGLTKGFVISVALCNLEPVKY